MRVVKAALQGLVRYLAAQGLLWCLRRLVVLLLVLIGVLVLARGWASIPPVMAVILPVLFVAAFVRP